MHKNIHCLVILLIITISGCSVFGGNAPLTPVPENDRPQAAEATAYTAPTLPPANTPTLAPTTTQTPPPTPSPFTVFIADTPTPEGGPSTSIPTTDFNFEGWERYETTYTRIAFDTPINMVIRDYGRLIRIGDPSFSDDGIQLFIEVQVDHAASGYLPGDVNPYDPHSVVNGILGEFEENYTDVTLIRPVTNANMNGYPGADTAVRTQLTVGSGTEEFIW
ncbi:MAG: hypothetical protein U9N80_10155, partial [Chloroflexota bacterium]|nr:hypothetical protein [Chloroflexota bacterium]